MQPLLCVAISLLKCERKIRHLRRPCSASAASVECEAVASVECEALAMECWVDRVLNAKASMPKWERKIRIASDCTGTGNAETSLNYLLKRTDRIPGVEVVWMSDSNPAVQQWLKKHFEPEYLLGDMNDRRFQTAEFTDKTVEGQPVIIEQGSVDIYTIGFPCTPFRARASASAGMMKMPSRSSLLCRPSTVCAHVSSCWRMSRAFLHMVVKNCSRAP